MINIIEETKYKVIFEYVTKDARLVYSVPCATLSREGVWNMTSGKEFKHIEVSSFVDEYALNNWTASLVLDYVMNRDVV